MSANIQRSPVTAFEPAAIPIDEGERLAALRQLAILDSDPSESFDTVTRLAAQVLRMPIVLVSLVDEHRQWFKSKVGLEADQTPRDVSFCAHAVYDRRALVVVDATQDARFAGNPSVTGAPHIRAYAGIPLFLSGGQPIGTLCAIDRQPRHFSELELAALKGFAKIIEEFLRARELARHTEGILEYAAEREGLFRATFEQAAVGMAHTALNGRLLRVNQRLCDMLGYSAEELLALTFVDITHPEDLAVNMQNFQRMVAGDVDNYRLDKRFLLQSGATLWGHLSVALKRTPAGQPDYLIVVVEDISEKKVMEESLVGARDSLQEQVALQTRKLQVSNEALQSQVRQALETALALRKAETRLRAIANNIPAVIGYWNSQLRCEAANEAYRRLYGVAPEDIIGMSMAQLLGETLFKLNEPYTRKALAGKAQHFERSIATQHGAREYYDTQYLPDFDDAGATRGFFVLETNVTDLRVAQLALEASNAKLHQESVTDYLTGLPNRRIFSERSELAVQRFADSGASYGLILMDLDDFKHINDYFGHDAGDEVLRTLGKVLKKPLRAQGDDLAARLGGEEFAVLCCGHVNPDSLRRLAECIRAQINEAAVRTAKGAIKFTASFGLALGEDQDLDWKMIYARADAALYEAKAAGKDRVSYGAAQTCGGTGRLRARRVAPLA